MTVYSIFPVLLAVSFTSAQRTQLYGTVSYGTTRLSGFVNYDATTEAPAYAETTRYNYYQQQTQAPYTFAPYSYQYGYTSPPEQYDRNRYGGSASASNAQSQSGRGVSVGGSASSSGSGRYSSGQQRPSDARYSGQASGYGGGQQPARYDPYAQQARPYDARRPQQSDPRSGQQGGRREPEPAVDYSRYPPTLKSIVLSETSIYLWWVDPAVQSGSAQRGQQSAANKDVKYSVKYSKVYPRQGEQIDEQTQELSERELHLKTLEPGTDYTFSIKTNRDGQETGWSAPVVNRTLEPLPQEAPTKIKVVPTDRDATINISPPENFKGSISNYIFLYAPSGGNGGIEARKWQELEVRGGYAGQPEVTTVLRGLLPGEEYFYTVQAVNSRGSSPFSEIESFKTTSGPVYPSPTRAPYGGSYDPYGRDQDRRKETTPDYYAAYRTTAYPRYEDNTPDYYGRYPSDSGASTPDYYGRYQTTEDPYAQQITGANDGDYATALGEGTTILSTYTDVPGSATDSQYWSPYWAAATVPSSERGGALEPPTDVRVEAMVPTNDSPSDQVEALVTFVPSSSQGVSEYEILYTYDPTASDDLWQFDTVPGGENQGILVRLTPSTRVHVKVRAKGPSGNSAFSEVAELDTVAYAGQPSGGDVDQYGQGGQATGEQGGDQQSSGDHAASGDHQAGGEDDRDPADNAEDDADTAHTRTNRT